MDQKKDDVRLTGWVNKFHCAFAGIAKGLKNQSSFYVHIPVAILVLVFAAFLEVDKAELCILLLCIAVVLVAEFFNTAIEYLAKAITDEFDENVKLALDVSAGAVLVASFFAAGVGVYILLLKMV